MKHPYCPKLVLFHRAHTERKVYCRAGDIALILTHEAHEHTEGTPRTATHTTLCFTSGGQVCVAEPIETVVAELEAVEALWFGEAHVETLINKEPSVNDNT